MLSQRHPTLTSTLVTTCSPIHHFCPKPQTSNIYAALFKDRTTGQHHKLHTPQQEPSTLPSLVSSNFPLPTEILMLRPQRCLFVVSRLLQVLMPPSLSRMFFYQWWGLLILQKLKHHVLFKTFHYPRTFFGIPKTFLHMSFNIHKLYSDFVAKSWKARDRP